LRERHLFLFNDLFLLASPQSGKKDKHLVKIVADLDNVLFFFFFVFVVVFFLLFTF